MEKYFIRTKKDEEFYNEFLRDRLPKKIVDAHIHISTPAICATKEIDPNSWAEQCMEAMTIEDYNQYAKAFYPDAEVAINALPEVARGVDIDGGNNYISDLKHRVNPEGVKVKWAHMLVSPDFTPEETEKKLIEGDFNGYKPYPDFVSGTRGADIGLFSFVTHDQLAILNKYKKSMVLHLPRAGRYPDDDNVKEVLTLLDKYPDIRLVLAHCGRCYAVDYIKKAKQKMGAAFSRIHYDLAAVLNPVVLDFMLENIPHENLMYGTDLPIFLWHGKRKWTNTEYYNLAREDFPWNQHEEGAEAESNYVFFLYEQLKNILDAADRFGGKEVADKVLWQNAENYFGK